MWFWRDQKFNSQHFELHAVRADPTASFYSPFLRFWELMAGSLLAWLKLYKAEQFNNLANRVGPYLSRFLQRGSKNTDYVRFCCNLLSALGLISILIGVFTLNSRHFPGSKALYPVLGAVMMIAAGKDAFLNRYLLSNRLMVWFGLISYPLYIWHWPFLSFAWTVSGELPQLKVRIACVALAVVMSAITYYLVEPHLRWGRHGGLKATGLLVAMITVGFLGWEIYHHNGYRNRVPIEVAEEKMVQRFDSISQAGNARYLHYFPELKDIWFGFFEKDAGYNSIALLGDSHAGALLPGLLVSERKNDGIVYFGSGCGIPFMGIQAGYAKEWQTKFTWHRLNYVPMVKGFDYVLNHPEIDKVVMANFPGCFQFWGISSFDNPALTSSEQILSDAVERTFKALADAGKKVVYVLDDPTFSKDGLDDAKVKACAAKLNSVKVPALPLRAALYYDKDKAGLDEVCSMPKDESGTLAGHDLLKKLVEREAAKYDNIHVVDLYDHLCDGDHAQDHKNYTNQADN